MTVYASICRDIRVSGFQMVVPGKNPDGRTGRTGAAPAAAPAAASGKARGPA
jgi:hypothetical protein